MVLHRKQRHKYRSYDMSIGGWAGLENDDLGEHSIPIFISFALPALLLQQQPSLLNRALRSLSTSRTRTTLQTFPSSLASSVSQTHTRNRRNLPSFLCLLPLPSQTYTHTIISHSLLPSFPYHTHTQTHAQTSDPSLISLYPSPRH